MKLWNTILLFLALVIMLVNSQNYDPEFEVFKESFNGPHYESIYSFPEHDFTESTYYGDDDRVNRRSFKSIDPQPKFTKSFLYVSPDDVEDRLIREKREKPDEDYDYAKTYREFVRENFGFNGNASPLTSNDNDDENYGVTQSDVEYDRIKQLSEKQSDSEFCKVVHKNGKQCTICKNPKNNAESEACSYSSNPAAKKYAYKRERNYNSKDDDDNDKYDEDASEKKEQKVPKNHDNKSNKSRKQSKKLSARRGSRYEPSESQNSAKALKSNERRVKTPRNNDQTFKSSELNTDERPYIQQHSANVDKVLEEFKTKDWSKCQRKSKNGLTCYYCKDSAGVSHEECMFISGDAPAVEKYDETIKESVPVKKSNRSRGSNARRSRKVESNSRVAQDDGVPRPEDQNTGNPAEKRTIKRMVSVKYQGNEDEPISNKSVFYAKKVTHVTK